MAEVKGQITLRVYAEELVKEIESSAVIQSALSQDRATQITVGVYVSAIKEALANLAAIDARKRAEFERVGAARE